MCFVEGDKIIVLMKPQVRSDLHYKEGKILKWHPTGLYTVLISGREYILFEKEIRKL